MRKIEIVIVFKMELKYEFDTLEEYQEAMRHLENYHDCEKKYKQGMNPNSRKGIFKKGNQNWKLRRTKIYSEKNPNWKGNEVGYSGVHLWIKRRKLKPEYCEECKEKKPFDLTNISGKYKRDINDFKWLCRKCHMKKDGRYEIAINNLKKSKKHRDKNGRFKRLETIPKRVS